MSDARRWRWNDEELATLVRQLPLRPGWNLAESARICCLLNPDAIPKYRRKYYERVLWDFDNGERRGLLKTAWDVSDKADPGAKPGEPRWHLVFVPRDVFVFATQHLYPPTGSPVPGLSFPYEAADFPGGPDAMTAAVVKAMAVARSFLSAPAVAASSTHAPEDRKAVVDGFIDRVLDETGQKITRTDIWQVAGYREATEFERWQRRDVGYEDGSGVDKKLRRVLSLEPAEFIRRLERRRLVVKVIPPSPA